MPKTSVTVIDNDWWHDDPRRRGCVLLTGQGVIKVAHLEIQRRIDAGLIVQVDPNDAD